MFELTLFDHLRMTFGHIVHRHRLHSELAQSRLWWDRALRIAEVTLITGVIVSVMASLYGRGYAVQLVAAVLAVLALLVLLCHLTLDLNRSAQAHAACDGSGISASGIALMSDLSDGAIGMDAVRQKRDELITDLRKVYEDAPPVERQAYRLPGRPSAPRTSIAERRSRSFLPKSRKPLKSARA
jgi:hypothetical protein